MILLENKANVTPPNPDYPYGAIKNDTGVGDGTPVDFQVYNDVHQFLSRLFALSGLTANGLPDNLTNGFQLYEAFEKLAGLQAWTTATITPTASTATPGATAVLSGTTYSKFKIVGKTFIWNFTSGVTTTGSPLDLSVTLPESITLPSGLSNGISVGGRMHTKGTVVTVNGSGASIVTFDGSAFPNQTNARLSFSVTFELA